MAITGQPVVTLVLIALNVVVYGITAVQAGGPQETVRTPLGTSWALWPPQVAAGDWWRVITSGFIHFGLLHIALNMVSLWIVGRITEQVLGRWRYAVVYGLALIGGGVAVFLFSDTHTQSAGASGAVFGIMGALLVLVLKLKMRPGAVLAIIGVNLVFSFSVPGISWQDHVGGLIVGALVTAGMVYVPSRRRLAWQLGTCAVVLAVLVALFVYRDGQFGNVICPSAVRCYVPR